MNTTPSNMTPGRSLGENANQLVDKAALGADKAIRTTQRVTNDALDHLSDGVDSVHNMATPAINRVAAEAERLARRGMDSVHETSTQLREKAQRASDKTIGYIKDEPVKSILIAAATGAALMALAALVSRNSARN